MIVVRVELHSAVTGKVTELVRMEVANDGTGTRTRRHYEARTLRGRNTKALNQRTTQRQTTLRDWPSEQLHVWNLVATLLAKMGYGQKTAAEDVPMPTRRASKRLRCGAGRDWLT